MEAPTLCQGRCSLFLTGNAWSLMPDQYLVAKVIFQMPPNFSKGNSFQRISWFFFCVCVSLSPCVCVCACTHAPTEAKRNTDTLELELQAFLSCPMWLLGSRLWSSDRAISVLDHWAIISSPRAFAFKICAPVNIRMFLPSPIGAFLKCKINQGYLNTSCLNTKAQLSSKYLKK